MQAYHGRAPLGQHEEEELEEEAEEEAGNDPPESEEEEKKEEEKEEKEVTPGRELPNLRTAPIAFLLGTMALAKLYLIPHILQMATQTLKYRLSYDNFDQVCTASVRWDVTAMRLHCVQYAQTNKKIRDLYHARGLSPVVESELAALFGEPGRHLKRRRVLSSRSGLS